MLDGVDEAESLRVVGRLEAAGVSASRAASSRGVGWRVAVGPEEVARAVETLRAEGPSPGGFAQTPARPVLEGLAAERARLDRALGDELALTLRRLNGVLWARVHLPEEPLPRLDEPLALPPRRAAVALHLRPGSPLDREAVRRLVADGVRGLSPEHVSLFVTTAAPSPPPPGLLHVGPFAVAPASAEPLRRALTLLLATNVALGSGAILLGSRRRRSRGAAPTRPKG